LAWFGLKADISLTIFTSFFKFLQNLPDLLFFYNVNLLLN